MSEENTILVVTVEECPNIRTRGERERKVTETKVEIEKLSNHIDNFIKQIGKSLEKTPDKIGDFQFVELEVHAEISAKGTLKLMGTGIETGTTGGLKFVFRRLPDVATSLPQ
jgi:translation initiation factor 2 beta subunit (eIF-2beta)/eIF-5